MKLKFVLNAMVTNHVLVTAEALNMGIASGLDPQQIIDAVLASVATSTQFELRAPGDGGTAMAAGRLRRPGWWKRIRAISSNMPKRWVWRRPSHVSPGTITQRWLRWASSKTELSIIYEALES